MRTKNETPYLFATRVTSRAPKKLEMVAIVRASFRLEPGVSKALFRERGAPLPQGMMSGDVFRPHDVEGARELVYASDFADYKPRADVLLMGTAYAPHGEPVTELPLRFSVGTWAKLLRVVGDRRWKGPERHAAPTAPRPFTAMALDWTRAWGGPGHPENPVGRDLGALEVPNVERPDEPIESRREVRRPAGFAPLNPRWPVRAKKLGSAFDGTYRERAPWYPADIDWAHFNAAPDDQQLPYLRGDEALALQNLLPHRAVFQSQLPGVRVRVFGRRVGGAIFELPMVLDTLLVDTHDEKLVLTWRGHAPADRVDLRDVPFTLVAEESLATPPRPATEYEKKLEAFAADPLGLDGWLTPELAALRKSTEVPTPDAASAPEALDALLGKRFGPLAEPHRAKIRDFLQRTLQGVGASPGASAAGAREAIAGAVAAAVARGAQKPGPAPVGGGGVRLRESVAKVEEAARMAQRQVAETGRRPRELSRLAHLAKDERVRALDPSLADAPTGRKRPNAPKPGGDCKGFDYSGRSFDGEDLHGVDFSRALLAKATFRNAKLGGARFDGAVATEADFSGADLADASFEKANLGRAILIDALLDRVRFAKASLEACDLRGARMVEAKGEEVILRAARLDGASLERASFVRAILTEATLVEADLTRARLEGCLCNQWEAARIKLDEAVLVRCAFNESRLAQASLRNVMAEACGFLQTHLGRADLRGAQLAGAMFLDADLTAARFAGADLRGTRFSDAVLREADFRGADLFEADFSRAKLDAASFRDANAYGASFWDAGGRDTHFDGANLARSRPERS